MTLTKSEIIDKIHEELGYPKNRSSVIFETLLELMKTRLEKGEDVLISGFGKFCVKGKQKRRGRNPATGEDLELAQRNVVTFRCSHLLREKINGEDE